MQAPDAWPGKEEVKHDCFQPQLQGYDGEYGRPHEAECQKCISIAYSIERLNEFGYKVNVFYIVAIALCLGFDYLIKN